MVAINQVSVRYADHQALDQIQLSIDSNKVTALIGPSGCGKSTLLRVILGLIHPTSGSVTIDGKPMNPENAEGLRRQIGYVVQDGGLFPHLTGAQNVSIMASFLGHGQAQIDSRLKELCDLTHIDLPLLSRFPSELSGGQRQRLGLMRALYLDPELLLLDEPLGALDPLVRAGLQTDLKEIFAKTGKTVVFVTHDMGEATYLADHIVLLRSGRIVQSGSLADFQDSPSEPFVTEFLNAQRQLGAVR